MRDTPKDLEDSIPFANSPQFQSPNFDRSISIAAPKVTLEPGKAKSLGRACYNASTDWINASRRMKWSYSLRAFQGLHANDSKYMGADYRYRSRLYRPKTRTMVRNAEAETADAFFANADVVDIQPQDDNDPRQLASSEILKALLNYRLTKTIPWFLTVVGARQDAEVTGICIGKAFWKYKEELVNTEHRMQYDLSGAPVLDPQTNLPVREAYDIYEKKVDKPWVDLIAAENFRFDPGADWRNPVATSPYIIELIPMYVADVRSKVQSGEWLPVAESSILGSVNLDDDTTRRAREAGRIPGKDNDAGKVRDFEIAWIHENVIRHEGQDWHFMSLGGSGELLTNPKPIEEVYLQGIRPYVVGFIVPEAHKTYPSSKVELVRDLQQQANDIVNLRMDNVKLTLNPRQFVRTGKNVDPADLKIFNPGKVVLMQDPSDIVWDRPPEVTQSSYMEQDKVNLDFDDLAGGTSAASVAGQPQVYQAVGNTEIMDGNANKMGQYELRVFAETFVEPILRQVVMLEQAYETDATILALAGKQANLFQKFGISQITDDLLQHELTVKVNVGVGATNPKVRLQNFGLATEMVGKIFPQAAQGASFEEVTKEIFSLCGYKDGSRFFMPGFNPSQSQHPDPTKQADAQYKMSMVDLNKAKIANMQTDNQRAVATHQSDMQMNQQQNYLKYLEIQQTQRSLTLEEQRFLAEQRGNQNDIALQAHQITTQADLQKTQMRHETIRHGISAGGVPPNMAMSNDDLHEGGTSPLTTALHTLASVTTQIAQQHDRSTQTIIAAITAPKVITTPTGQRYTSQTVAQNG